VGLDDIASIWSDLVSKLSLSFFFAVSFLSKTRLCHLRLFIIFFISCSVLFLRLKIYNVSHISNNFCEKNSRDIDIYVTIDYLLLHLLELLAHFLDYLRLKGFHLLCGERGSVVDSVYLEKSILRGRAESLAY